MVNTNRGEFWETAVKSYDNFGRAISNPVSNEDDIAAHYPFNPERWRLFKNGSRQFVQYGSVTGFTDNADNFTIAPSGGGTFDIKRPIYDEDVIVFLGRSETTGNVDIAYETEQEW